MINFFKNIFKKGDEKIDFEQEQKNIFKEQVENALKKCIEDQKQEITNIDNIKKWAKDIIFEIYNVPTAFWYEELNEYENIKFHESNLSISKTLIEKTDLLIEEYREQIKLSETKIIFCNTLINEYKDIIKRYDETARKIGRIKKEEEKIKLLKKHQSRIDTLRSKTENFQEIYSETGMLDVLQNDINNIEDDFKIKQEVSEYMENLDKDFSADTDNIDSLPFRNEIEKLTSEIKK